MQYFAFIATVSFLLCSCNSDFDFKKVSDFNVVEGVIPENAAVKIIYSSGGPDYNEDLEYYMHTVVVVQETNDTINVLTTSASLAKTGDVIRYYVSKESSGNKVVENLDKILSGEVTNVSELEGKKIEKVVVNNLTAADAVNSYPTTIGLLVLSITDSLENPMTVDHILEEFVD